MEFSDLSGLVITRIFTASIIYSETGSTNYRTCRPNWAIVYKFEGETCYTSGGKKHISNAENFAVLPKGSEYEFRCTERGRFFIFEFDAEPVFPTVRCFRLPQPSGERMMRQCLALQQTWLLKKPGYLPEFYRDAYGLIAWLQTVCSPQTYIPSDRLTRLRPALDYLTQNYTKIIRNEELAALASMSTVYFRKLFTEAYGISPISYQHRLRIEKAKELLHSDYGSIADVAQSLGYLNIYHFSKAFKQHTGLSPTAYVRSLSTGTGKDDPASV